jgi:N utilization substance protein B
MLVKTLKSQPDEAGKPSLSPLSADWEDDKDFTQKLFNQTIEHQRAYVRLLGEQSDNWDASRFSHTDMVIMTMCLTEVLNFQQIPVKVSINEYLEVARLYSTPQSFQFINAVLDALAQKLQEQGRVKKTGRGLI